MTICLVFTSELAFQALLSGSVSRYYRLKLLKGNAHFETFLDFLGTVRTCLPCFGLIAFIVKNQMFSILKLRFIILKVKGKL